MGAVKATQRTEWLDAQVRAYEQRLVRYCCRFAPAEVAREIVQESFVRLWGQGEVVYGREREWLFHVCRNLSIDHLRREKRVRLIEENGVTLPVAEETLSFQEDVSNLQHTIARLKPAEREVVRLKFQENMSYKEIAAITGHSVSYVGVLVHQAVEKLRQWMAADIGKGTK
jgi:RNA polymerase sigma factor (sigma-70 family)